MKCRKSSLSAYSLRTIILIFMMMPRMAWSQRADWTSYKEHFVSPEGRVIDDGNNGVSHSEGQGYGLILAEINDDRETFDRIWDWTTKNLRKRADHLFSWRWKPADGGGAVDDKNNATDGDLLIAWGLARAAKAWDNAEFKAAAVEIAQDVRRLLIRPSRFGPILLPAAQGFEKPEGLVVNLSYWVFPAFRTLARIDPSLDWGRLERSGLKLVEAARFSPLNLPPDWLFIDKKSIQIAKGFEAAYGYNAIRIPLYMVWGNVTASKYYSGFRAASAGTQPAKIYLPSGKADDQPALEGMKAIYRLIAGIGNIDPATLQAPYDTASEGERYYSMSLGLLCNRAVEEARKMNQPK